MNRNKSKPIGKYGEVVEIQLIDLTLANISKFWVKDEGVCTKVAFAIKKTAISLKRSSLEPKLLQSVYRYL